MAVADYVVVGTGSAGSVVAERLSADKCSQVVVLEAGPEDKDKLIHIPAAFSGLFRSAVDWDYLTEPQAGLNNRRIYWPRGKMLGGSSSMNAMMWVRGFAADYDEWAEHTGPEWSFARLVEYFTRIESSRTPAKPTRAPTVRCISRGSVVRADRPRPGSTRRSSPATSLNDRICLSRRDSARQW